MNAAPVYYIKEPAKPIRWFRPFISTSHLELLPTPVLAQTTESDKWVALIETESDECERRWNELDPSQKLSESEESGEEYEKSKSELKTREIGVGIGKEKLFEVDVKRMRLKPIYWRSSEPALKLRRVTWLYDENHPVEDDLAAELDAAFSYVEPWKDTYQDELDAALSHGSEGYDKIKHPFTRKGTQMHIIFEDQYAARIVSQSTSSTISAAIFSAFRSSSVRQLPLGTIVYRGYEMCLERSGLSPKTTPPEKAEKEPASIEPRGKQDGTGRIRSLSMGMGDSQKHDVTDLVLVIHGIGQGLAASWEAFNFVYATNLLRQIAEKQSSHPAIASIMRSRRVQFLPVLWKANLKLSHDEEMKREEDGLYNNFTLEDITLKNKIPYVRDVMNNVLIDVPYFMSHHRQRMVETVCDQANEIYRLWCERNPGFDKSGRVHLIAHSLGSALAAHILSNQPTIRPPLSSLTEDDFANVKDKLIFDTSCLFMLGSPLGVFLHLSQSPIIARKNRERTRSSPPDEALDKEGVFGCLAVDSLYNIFNVSDPIAYRLNPCVDSDYGKQLLPFGIPNLTTSFTESITSTVYKYFPFQSSPSASPKEKPVKSRNSDNRSPSRPRVNRNVSSAIELGAPNEIFSGTLAERRLKALNPHGTIDFFLPSEGNISEYIDMLTAHASYWGDPNFASFVLSELCSRPEDRLRTGLRPERPERTR